MNQLLNHINTIEENLNKLKYHISNSSYEELLETYFNIELGSESLLRYIEIDIMGNGIFTEDIFTHNFSIFIDYILRGADSIDLEIPKNIFNCKSEYHIENLQGQSAILTCKFIDKTLIYNFNFTRIPDSFENCYNKFYGIHLYYEEKINTDNEQNINITWQQGLRILDRVSKYSKNNYLESLNVICK
ncbi:hypothetical protein [Aliarcobacter butzleri]|uniref:hypothetical protein n=1 Tax=Aliarcobacter butzleri TaxID=28197 RepID=UPI000F4AEF7F|nr:hypothetical protein [Aliarcobacter butzleri]